MIKDILNTLNIIKESDVELIQIAKGKYKYPETFKSLKTALKTLKNK